MEQGFLSFDSVSSSCCWPTVGQGFLYVESVYLHAVGRLWVRDSCRLTQCHRHAVGRLWDRDSCLLTRFHLHAVG